MGVRNEKVSAAEDEREEEDEYEEKEANAKERPDFHSSFTYSSSMSLLQRINRLECILDALENKSGPRVESSRSIIGGSSRYLGNVQSGSLGDSSSQSLGCGSSPSLGDYLSQSFGVERSLSSSSPSRFEKYCRPVESVLKEIELKGTLVERVASLEKRISMCCSSYSEVSSPESKVQLRKARIQAPKPVDLNMKDKMGIKEEISNKKGIKEDISYKKGIKKETSYKKGIKEELSYKDKKQGFHFPWSLPQGGQNIIKEKAYKFKRIANFC